MPNKWTRESIIRHLLDREAKGLSLTVGGQGVSHALYSIACRFFGSWRNAIQAAGIAPQQVLTWERWSPARILVMVRHLARRDRPLTTEEMDRRYHNLASSARRHFGSWTKAVLAAGVEPARLQKVALWTRERVIEGILTRALRNESLVARSVEPRTLVDAAQRFFGSWKAAVAAAGLDPALASAPPKRHEPARLAKPPAERPKPPSIAKEPWSKERIVARLQARLRDGKPMHSAAIAREDNTLYQAFRRHLGSWDQAMRAAGLDPDAHRRGPARRSSAPDGEARPSVSRQSQANDTLRPDRPA